MTFPVLKDSFPAGLTVGCDRARPHRPSRYPLIRPGSISLRLHAPAHVSDGDSPPRGHRLASVDWKRTPRTSRKVGNDYKLVGFLLQQFSTVWLLHASYALFILFARFSQTEEARTCYEFTRFHFCLSHLSGGHLLQNFQEVH